MNETQKRIKAYQKALPGMKERVSAVALLLVVSIAMMTSATFAWMTLSRNPEISSIATTVTTNGNLEIALSDTDGEEPDETTVADGGQDILLSNLTWGNLVNLSDQRYGLSDISLRPASLNTNKLNSSPVYSTEYGMDGRVEGYVTDFAFTNYDAEKKQYMVPSETQYGVRGVSSVTYKQVTGDLYLVNQLDAIYKLYAQACTDFRALYGNESYMKVVYKLVQEYANVALDRDGYTRQDISGDMDEMMAMMNELMAVVETMGTAYAEMANLAYYQTLQDAANYDPYELQDVINNKIPAAYTKNLTYYSQYRTLYSNTLVAYNGFSEAAATAEQNKTVVWDDIESEANILCNMATAEVNGYTVTQLKANIKADVFGFGTSLLGWDVVPAVIKSGVLKDVDQFLAGDFYVESRSSLEVSVTFMGLNITLHPYVYTAAYQSNNSYTMADYNATEEAASKGTNLKGEPTAAETYAMALDLWVRTNEEDALLILEGDFVTETRTVTGTDSDGNEVDYYVYEYTDSEAQEGMQDKELTVYKLTVDGTDTWYVAESHKPVTEVLDDFAVTAENPAVKTEEVKVGYEGVNRVWDELDDPHNAAVMIPAGTTSTTQGSGSCYVFYYDSLEDQDQSLKLLSAMRVAFVSEKGKLLATAYMDTENAIKDSGRVIVPLQLNANVSVPVGTNGDTEEYYITRLNQNEATRITALIYLEGGGLENSDVLAAGSITGQLNIQFGTNTAELDPMDHNDLMQDYYAITRIAPAGSATNPYTFGEDEDWVVDVKMLLDGITPSSVKGNFISVINATQGARQDEFTLTLNPESGYYEATVQFDAPGNYQLRSLQIEGVDYALDADDIVYVKVPGIGISSVNWGDATTGNTKAVMTAASSYPQLMTLSLGSDDGKIHTVQGVFLGDTGKNVTVNFSSTDGVHYTGTGTFAGSGTYKMTYVYVDGVVTALDESQYKTMDISLGLTTEVRLSTPVFADGVTQADQERILSELTFTPGVGYSFIYTGEQMLYFDIVCTIYDDGGEPIDGEAAGYPYATLYYGQGTTQNALTQKLEWNGSAYTGTFDFQKFGIFNFSALELRVEADKSGANYITKATTAHSITSIPADPMEYVRNSIKEDDEVVFDLGGARTISLKLANASAAKLIMTLDYTDGEENTSEVVLGDDADEYSTDTSDDDTTTFTFTLPADGLWTIKDVQAGTVFYNDVFYSGETDETGEIVPDKWLSLMDVMPEDENLSVKFVTEVSAELVVEGATDNVFDLGENTIGSTFALTDAMTMKVVFKAYDGTNIAVYANQDLTAAVTGGGYFRYKNTVDASGTPGSVEISGEANIKQGSDSALSLTVGSFTVDGIWSVAAEGVTVTLSDGTDTEEFTIRKSDIPDVKVTWTKPVVTVTGTNPSPGTVKRVYTVKAPTTAAQAIQGDFFSISEDGFRATVYIYTPAAGGDYDQEAAEAYAPEVTLSLTGAGDATDVTMAFTTKNSDSVGSTFLFENGSAKAAIGKAVTGVRGWFGVDDYPECYPAGTMTQNKLTFTYNDVTYEVTLANAITIDQPQSPSAVNFVGIPESYTGDRPAQVIGQGTSVTVELPELAWTARIEEPQDGTWSAYTAVGEVAEVNGQKTKALAYTTWTAEANCSETTYYTYQYFTWTKFQSSITAETDIYTQDKQITKWIINGKTYDAGQTVTVTGNGIINATAVVSNAGEKTFVETTSQTTYKYLYGYVAQSKVTKTESAPDMTVNIIGEVGDTENATLASAKIANISNANAATDTPGTNTTTDSAAYTNYWP